MRRVAILLVVLTFASQGCAYVGNRWRDAGDMADIGFTLSKEPQFALYLCAFGLAGAGWGHIDGDVLGLFGGRVGLQPMKADVWSAGPIGEQTIQYGDRAPIRQCTGAVCILRETPDGKTKSSSCCHYLHLGWLGVAGNLHYKEIADFGLGFLGADICGDDLPSGYVPKTSPLPISKEMFLGPLAAGSAVEPSL